MKSCVEVFAFRIRENCIIPWEYVDSKEYQEGPNTPAACGYGVRIDSDEKEERNVSACLSEVNPCKYFHGISWVDSTDEELLWIKCSCSSSHGYTIRDEDQQAETLQSITYRAFELAESAIKAAIAQAIEEQFGS